MSEAGTGASTSTDIGCTPQNILRIDGILKIVEFVFALVVMICAASDKHFLKSAGGGWVMFVAVTSALIVLAMFIIYLLNVISRIGTWWCLAEFIYYSVFTMLFVTCCIVCARADHDPIRQAALDTAVVFSFLSTMIYHVDTFLKYRDYKLTRDQ